MRKRLGYLWLANLALVVLTGCAAPKAVENNTNVRPNLPPKVLEHIARSEYYFSQTRGGTWSAPNRSNNFRITIDEKGIAITPRRIEAKPWAFHLQLTGVLSKQIYDRPAIARISAKNNYLELVHEDLGVLEKFVNTAGGLEHTVVVNSPLLRRDYPDQLILQYSLSDDLIAKVSYAEQGVMFVEKDGEAVLTYSQIEVVDQDGTRLSARVDITNDALTVQIEDAEAHYPLVITALYAPPTIRNSDWETQEGQTGSQLGYSIAGAGDINGDGYSDVVVGVPEYDNGQLDEGRAYVYMGSPTGFSDAPSWYSESDRERAQFGFSVASAGDINGDGFSDVIIGAPGFGTGYFGGTFGKAYVFVGSASGVSPAPHWTREGRHGQSKFGRSVAGAGDVNGDGISDIIVGAPGSFHAGEVFVFHGGPDGPSMAPDWTIGEQNFGHSIGHAVAAAGDVNGDGFADVIVGAPDGHGGAAYIVHGSATGLNAAPSWTAVPTEWGVRFGASVSGVGDVNGDGYSDVIVGAPYYTGYTNPCTASYFTDESPPWSTELCPEPVEALAKAGGLVRNAWGVMELHTMRRGPLRARLRMVKLAAK